MAEAKRERHVSSSYVDLSKGKARGGGSAPLTPVTENYAKTTTNFPFLFCDYNVKVFGDV